MTLGHTWALETRLGRPRHMFQLKESVNHTILVTLPVSQPCPQCSMFGDASNHLVPWIPAGPVLAFLLPCSFDLALTKASKG